MTSPAEQPAQPNANAYLHPQYWDGAMFGVTPAQPLTDAELNNRGWHYAEAYLELFLESKGSNHVALQTLRDGTVWDAAEQEPGTIVVMHQENLTAMRRFDRSKIPELAAEHPVPERQIYVAETFFTRESFLSYKRDARYGVVVAGKGKEPNRLFHVPKSGVGTSRDGKPIVGPNQTLRAATRTTVGATLQVSGERTGSESLERVNLIEVVGAGVARRRRRERLRWLPGLAPKPAGDM